MTRTHSMGPHAMQQPSVGVPAPLTLFLPCSRPVWMPSAIDAAKTRDSRGRLPLHTLCTNDAVTPGMLKVPLCLPGSVSLCPCRPIHVPDTNLSSGR